MTVYVGRITSEVSVSADQPLWLTDGQLRALADEVARQLAERDRAARRRRQSTALRPSALPGTGSGE